MFGKVKPLIMTMGAPAAQASQDRPLLQPYEEFGVADPAHAVLERQFAGHVLGAGGDVIPDDARRR